MPLAVLLFVFADPIAKMIAADEASAAFTAQYLKYVGFSLFGYGILVTTNAAMNARSKAIHSMLLSLIRIFAIYLPCAWVEVWLFDYTGILAATVLANLLVVLGALIAARSVGLFDTTWSAISGPAKRMAE